MTDTNSTERRVRCVVEAIKAAWKAGPLMDTNSTEPKDSLGDGFSLRPYRGSWKLSGPPGFTSLVLHGTESEARTAAASHIALWRQKWAAFPDSVG